MNRTAVQSAVIAREPLETFRAEVLRGLGRRPRSLPCKYFYDAAGAALFERITQLPEYYLTRTELAIFERHLPAMADAIGPRAVIVEPGSGSGRKTRLLLAQLDRPAAYVPIDVSSDQLAETGRALAHEFPSLQIAPVCEDFTHAVQIPATRARAAKRVVFFPGSTLGNLTPVEADAFLRQTARLIGVGGGLLLGIDLRKPVDVLLAAYNDAAGVTAMFNLNVLRRVNRELGGTFDLAYFRHRASYDEDRGRIEMYLDSLVPQTVHVAGETFDFEGGESILTEYSHKYDLDDFTILAREAGFRVKQTWTDDARWFGVLYLEVAAIA